MPNYEFIVRKVVRYLTLTAKTIIKAPDSCRAILGRAYQPSWFNGGIDGAHNVGQII